jgi:hypothetical protein
VRNARRERALCYYPSRMSAPARPTHRPWEPEALELPLEPPRRVPPSYPVIVPSDGEDERDDVARGERAGSYVVVIDIA